MKIAIVGATGLVGRNIIQLCEKNFNSDVEYSLFASKSSEGKEIKINDKEFPVKELKKEILKNMTFRFSQLAEKGLKNMQKSLSTKGHL